MFEKFKSFWKNFFDAFKKAFDRIFRDAEKRNTQDYRDISKINLLAEFVDKLSNLANIECTYEVESDSTQAEPLIDLCADLENKRFDITSEFLGTGDLWVFPAHNAAGKLYHSYLTQDRVRILGMDGDNIIDVMGILDIFTDAATNRTYMLNRRHTLDGDALVVETSITTDKYENTTLDKWEHLVGVYRFENASHIGVGRFKSPASSRGLSPVYGVPLNFGCEEIEAKIFNDLKMIETEFKHGESKMFADPVIMKKTKDKNGDEKWDIPEGMYAINRRAGETGPCIDIYSPAIRYSEFRDKLVDDMMQYEKQVGTDRGFLTPFEESKATTATEIRRSNASTIALIDRIHSAIKAGVEMTLAADALYLNIDPDLYALNVDFFDPFEDTDKQYERIANAVDRGVLEKADELRWMYPNMTDDEIEEKLARIGAQNQTDTDAALESLLNGGA